ncbi:MAG: cysteine--tRNA ligase [Myxococcota bacterium]|nr:cysteine--tRNA ligase [Myxococcota bacterium]
MAIRIYNVLTKKKELFAPIHADEVGIYVCGVTVYGTSHVGHLRCYLSFDAIIRYLEYRGYAVRYIRNFTDIDDKIIKRAAEIAAGPDGAWRNEAAYQAYDQEQWRVRLAEDAEILDRAQDGQRHLAEIVSDYFIEAFRDRDLAPFDPRIPESEPRVSEHIPEVISLIEKIIGKGFAYVEGGDVYFDVPAYHEATSAYGALSGRDYTKLLEGARVAPTEKKRHGPDFALWKSAGPGEPAWPSPWGPGRPGWHIECSAMSVDKLGQPFDIHGGGKDLIFPHHENEIAQSQAATGERFCNIWMHNGFVTVNGVKMSKSLGNFITIQDALEIAQPEVWRLLVLLTHYASPIDMSQTPTRDDPCGRSDRGTINIACERLTYFYETLNRAMGILKDQDLSDAPSPSVKIDVRAQFVEAMDDDFNTPRALAAIGEGMRHLNELCDMRAKQVKKMAGGKPAWLATIKHVAEALTEVCGVLGLCTRPPAEAMVSLRDFAAERLGLDRNAIEEKIARRNQARAAKDWSLSDALRDELLNQGIEICDTPNGTAWKVIH